MENNHGERIVEISSMAIQDYCLQAHGDSCYGINHDVGEEISSRIASARPSKHKLKEFLGGSRKLKNAGDLTLLEDDDIIYVLRRQKEVIRILSQPGKGTTLRGLGRNRRLSF